MADSKSQSQFKPNSAKYSRRIVDKAPTIQHTDGALLDVTLPAVQIEQSPERSTVQRDRQCIDRKITAVKIIPNRTRLDSRQRRRGLVPFSPGGGNIQLESIT